MFVNALAEIAECTCERCEYTWFASLSRNDAGKIETVIPIACARCKSAYWNRPRPKETAKRFRKS